MSSIILAILIIISLILFYIPVNKRLSLIKKGRGGLNSDNFNRRFNRVISEVLFQSKVIKERPFAGLMHALVFWGFLGFVIITLNHFAKGFGWNFLGGGVFYKIISSIVAVFAAAVIIGISSLAIRRFIFRPAALGEHTSWSSGLVALFIEILMITYLLELYALPEHTAASQFNWWLHSITILAFIILIPQSKHLHLVLSLFTVFFKDEELARIRPLDFEKEEMGAEKIFDLDKHTLLGAFSCVECGRCYDQCPARNTDKTLDPKQWMLDIRKALLTQSAHENPSEVMNFDMIWQCTTCGACTYQCPVGIDQVIPLIEFRRGFVSGGEFPSPMRALFDNLERSGNPWKYQPHEAIEFIEKSGIPWYKDQETLYWMGCMGRYDFNYRKAALAFTELLKTAGVNYGVLKNEKCTGDAARRAGNEMIFQMLAEENIELLNSIPARKIVTTCPHCLRTLEEYKDLRLNKNFVIVHHTDFINELIDHGKLKLTGGNGKSAVYHDPCYLSRYQYPKGVESPRRLLKAAGIKIREAENHLDHSFCCGAGGGMLFAEETEGKRINIVRTEELIRSGAKTICTACPFCQLMLKDGLADKGIEGIEIKDITQMIKESVS
ncbi:(Fe-S)-binding protein [bacterium]|nr:(Fe-S)-binding protein [bacterium]